MGEASCENGRVVNAVLASSMTTSQSQLNYRTTITDSPEVQLNQSPTTKDIQKKPRGDW